MKRTRLGALLLVAACGGAEDAPYDVGRIVADLPGPRATLTEREAARVYLQAQLGDLGLAPERDDYATGANVVATIPATTGDDTRRIVVGAHFDTVANSPGANDNASGVAAVLAVGDAVLRVRSRRYAVTLVLFDEEEVGLLGARTYARSLAPADVVAVHTIDQVGWDGDGDGVYELELPTAALEAAYRDAAADLGISLATTSTEGTDHQAFRDLGFAATGLSEEYAGGDTTPYRHSPQDTADTVDDDYLARAAELVSRVVIAGVH